MTSTVTTSLCQKKNLGHLSIWISDLDKACDISPRVWYVTIYDCHNNPLVWCGKTYAVMPAHCGHLEVDVPPGCYRISAVWSYYKVNNLVYGNHFTDSAIVSIKCTETVCVKLYAPILHRCGLVFSQAAKDFLTHIKYLNTLPNPDPKWIALLEPANRLVAIAGEIDNTIEAMIAIDPVTDTATLENQLRADAQNTERAAIEEELKLEIRKKEIEDTLANADGGGYKSLSVPF